MKKDWLWDRNLDETEIKAVFSDVNNSRFVSYSALLLSRKNSAKEVFKDFFKKEDFFVSWNKIKKQMRRNSWNDPRIEYWQAIYDTLKKIPGLEELKLKEFEEPVFPLGKEIGNKIKEARQKYGLTQKKLAQRLKISQQIISRIESGKQNISLETLNNVCKSLGIVLNAEKFGFKETEKPQETSSRDILHFGNFPPERFTRMCFWLVERSSEFDRAEYYDMTGDKKRDVIGYKYNRVGKEGKWYFQCKRYKKIYPGQLKKELDGIKRHVDEDENFKPDRIVFVTACPVSPSCKDDVKKYAKTLSFEIIDFWDNVKLDEKVKANPETEEEFFGKVIRLNDLKEISQESDEDVKSHVTDLFRQAGFLAKPDLQKTDEINKEIDEAVTLIDESDFDQAKHSLFLTLGKIKDKLEDFRNELVRIYNNLGVCFLRPDIESGDLKEAEKYLSLALQLNPDFKKASANLVTVYFRKSDLENSKRAYDLAADLWKTSDKTESFIFQAFIFSTYYFYKSAEKAIECYKNSEKAEALVKTNNQLMNLMGRMYLETKNYKTAEELAESALEIAPNSPNNLWLKAQILLRRSQEKDIIPSFFEVVPRFRDYQDIERALKILEQALEALKNENNHYLEQQVKADMLHCYLWLRRTNEAKFREFRESIDASSLSQIQRRQLRIQDLAVEFQKRHFESAYTKLTHIPEWPKMDYQEKIRDAHLFYLKGAPEQSKEILKQLEVEAEQKRDEQFWLDVSMNEVLLENKNLAIKAAQKAKDFSRGKDSEKKVLSHFNALMMRYATSGEVDRLMEGMFECQKKYPDEKVIWPVPAIDKDGKPTEEIKAIFLQQEKWYEGIKQTFRSQPVISYYLEEVFKRPYADILSMQYDPEFIIPLTLPDESFEKKLTENVEKTENIVFDYASLLNLSKMNLLGHLEKFGKKLFITEKLFLKVQTELIMFEHEDLRRLWNFLRKSKEIHFIEESKAELKENIAGLFDPWIIDSIKAAKEKNAVFVVDDLRFLRFLKSENIRGSNSFVILRSMLSKEWIDEKVYSTSLGDLAERFYTFLPFSADDLFRIVMEDHSKRTPRTSHLVNQLFLPGSNASSFTRVFVKFIDLLWKTGSLAEDKMKWLEFLTEKIIKYLDDNFDIQNDKEVEKIVPHFIQTWIIAVQRSNRDEINILQKKVNEVLDKPYLAIIRNNIVGLIETKISSFI